MATLIAAEHHYEIDPVDTTDFDGKSVRITEVHKRMRFDDEGKIVLRGWLFLGRRITKTGKATGLHEVRILASATERAVLTEAGLAGAE